MSLTVAETVRELEKLKHQRAVWLEIVEHLSRCVDKESKVADGGIPAEDCIVSIVPQEVVREFIDRINNDEIEPLNQEIESLENLYVEEDNDEGDPGQEESREEKKGQSKKGILQKGGKKKGPTTGVRRLTRTPKRKGQGAG